MPATRTLEPRPAALGALKDICGADEWWMYFRNKEYARSGSLVDGINAEPWSTARTGEGFRDLPFGQKCTSLYAQWNSSFFPVLPICSCRRL